MVYLFQFRRYRLPFRTPVRTAHGPWGERVGLLVRLTDATGRVGYGEAAPIPWFGTETVDEVEAACRELGEKVDEARLAAVPGRLGCLRNALTAAQVLLPVIESLVGITVPAGAAPAGMTPDAARAYLARLG